MLPKTPQRKIARAPNGVSYQNESLSRSEKHSSRKGHKKSDSHDLSLHNVTRDSMVENMLSSFDKMPEPESLYDRVDENIPGLVSARYNSTTSNYGFDAIHKHRQPSQDSSFASDYSLHAELPERCRPVPDLQRKHEINEAAHQLSPEKARISSPELRDGRQPRDNILPSPGRSRKSSAASNVDAESKNFSKSRLGRRSRHSSVDQKSDSRAVHQSRSNIMNSSILDRARPVPVEYHNFDAAAVSMPGLAPDDRALSAAAFRQNLPGYSQQSSYEIPPRGSSHINIYRNQGGNRNKPVALSGSGTKPGETTGDVSRSLSQPKILESQFSRPNESMKEKQGFFKRVFGSSKPPAPGLDVAPQLPPLVLRRDESSNSMDPRAEGTSRLAPQSMANGMGITSMIPPPPVPDEHVLVVKKKSSFFARNRKKATGENVAPSQLDAARAAVAAEHILPNSRSANPPKQLVRGWSAEDTGSPEDQFFDSREEQPSSPTDHDENIKKSPLSTSTAQAKETALTNDQSASRHHGKPRPDNSRIFSSPEPQRLDLFVQRTQSQGNEETPVHVEKSVDRREIPVSPVLAAESPSIGHKAKKPQPASANLGLAKISMPLVDTTNQYPPTVSNVHASQPRTSSYSHYSKGYPQTQSYQDGTQTSVSDTQDDDWVHTVSTKGKGSAPVGSPGTSRVWLQPLGSDENFVVADPPPLPPEGAAGFRVAAASPTVDEFVSATASPVIQIDGQILNSPAKSRTAENSDRSPKELEIAGKIFHGNDDYANEAKRVHLLGDSSQASSRLRNAYMDFFDFTGLNILAALRKLCGKLVLKGETQQVDRILAAFSQRWCDCNSTHGFKSKDVVHTICYSILLLNTDLHIADLDTKMTRAQFVKNTLPTIRKVAADDNDNTLKANPLSPRSVSQRTQARSPSPVSPGISPVPLESHESLEIKPTAFRLSIRPPKVDSDRSSPAPIDSTEISDMLVDAPFDGTSKAWEYQIETLLKEVYAAIRQERLPLHGFSDVQLHEQASHNSLSITSSTLRRTGSINSKAPSDSHSARNRGNDLRTLGSRFIVKNRSRSKVYGTSTVGSSRTSLDESSMWSPNASSTWSRSVFGKTQTTMSTDSLGSHFTNGEYGYQQSIGFANALSQSIIREDSANQLLPDDMENMLTPLLEDESLELAGAPWAKEGIVHHKHHLITTDKKAKDRNWDECFAVVEKGYMKLFSFNSKASVRSQKKPHGRGNVVGGGNWMDNAENVGSFLLRQTIANALPPPGYSKTRPHVFALSLPTGAVHLFHVGTPEIAKEFVTTANYWSARLSKEPLVGSVSNIEYGWSEAVINTALIRGDMRAGAQSSASNNYPHSISHSSRPSFQGSMRSSVDHGMVKTRLPGDKITLSEWRPPQQSLLASTLKEADQLEGLQKYVSDVEEELSIHNELRPPMLLAFTPSHPNARKAMSNWERKSSYLLREIVKFRTYIESLKAAKIAKEKRDADMKTSIASVSMATSEKGDMENSKSPKDVVDEGYSSMYRATTSKERLADAAAAVIAH